MVKEDTVKYLCIFFHHLKKVIIHLKQIYNDTKELNFLLFIYKNIFTLHVSFDVFMFLN